MNVFVLLFLYKLKIIFDPIIALASGRKFPRVKENVFKLISVMMENFGEFNGMAFLC